MLAMHMANELLSVPMAAVTLVIAALIVAYCARRVGVKADASKIPLMGVMGAFVFAAQMINFTLPAMPGTSGHLGGGVLLAIVLGPEAAIVTIAGVLIIQCLFFGDGGLLALGCNIINMGVVPSLLGYGIYKLIRGPVAQTKAWRTYIASWLACVVGVAGGAALVPLQAVASGVLAIPMADFLSVMIGVHLFIGFIEGAITFAVVAYLMRARPAIFGSPAVVTGRPGKKAVGTSLVVTAMLLGAVGCWFASSYPDGLEWSYQEHSYGQSGATIKNESPTIADVDVVQAKWTVMPDYSKRTAVLGHVEVAAEEESAESAAATAEPWPAVDGWKSLAGVGGVILTLLLVWMAARLITRKSKSPTPQPQ